MEGMPASKGRWTIEVVHGPGVNSGAQISVCADPVEELQRQLMSAGDKSCSSKVVRNEENLAELQQKCARRQLRTVLQKTGSRELTIEAYEGSKTKTPMLRAKYYYVGECSGDENKIGGGASDAEACRELKAQITRLKASNVCEALPEDRKAACQQRMKTAEEQLKTMCPKS